MKEFPAPANVCRENVDVIEAKRRDGAGAALRHVLVTGSEIAGRFEFLGFEVKFDGVIVGLFAKEGGTMVQIGLDPGAGEIFGKLIENGWTTDAHADVAEAWLRGLSELEGAAFVIAPGTEINGLIGAGGFGEADDVFEKFGAGGQFGG